MTEYDYSPEAYEQHLAKQARIARWVDNTNEYTPANPFHPLPGVPDEHGPSTPPAPHPFQSNPVPPAPTTYTQHTSGAARRHKSRHNSHQSSFTINPPAALGLPLGEGVYMGARQSQLAQPISAGSMTVASISSQHQWFPYTSPPFRSLTASAVHLPFGSQTRYPYGQPYPSPPISSTSQSPYQPNNFYSQAPYSSSSVLSLPLPASSSSVGPYPQIPNQPVVVPLSGGGFVVLPPGQQVQVMSAKDFYGTERNRDSDLDSSRPSFRSSGLGGNKPKPYSRNDSRR